jgi:predicted nucleotidyltransferase
MGKEELLRTKRQEILELAARYGAYNVRLFGSVARGESGPTSDIDFLVDLAPDVGLEYIALWQDLQDLLGCDVDVVTEQALPHLLRDRVLHEAIPL